MNIDSFPNLPRPPSKPVKSGAVIKPWFPNSTGRDTPMTSRFGIEHNKMCENLRPPPIYIPGELTTVKMLQVSSVGESTKAPGKRSRSLTEDRGLINSFH
tara:strand:- start:361 stop:660 length:300 start_codon:yes stop_codon:yes gene_type:complete